MNGVEELPNRLNMRKGAVTEKKKKFSCKICGKVFTDKYYLQTHSQIHSDVCSFKCDQCSYKGKTRKYLMRHKKKCHSKPTSNECEYCGKKFHYKSSLVKHSWVHTGEKPYKCEICGKAFNTKYSLNTHKFIHTDEKPFQCSFCEYACRDSSTLSKHQARHMGIERVYKCKMCDKSYKMKWKLKEHVADKHLALDVRKYECDECGKRFKLKTNLKNHIQSVHERMLTCTCEVCGTLLSNKGNLLEHMRRHIDVRPFKCGHRGCRKTFKTTGELRKHEVIHSPSQHYACERCGRMFSRRHRRDLHTALHCKGGTSRTIFKCEHCTHTVYSKRLLSAHMKMHSVVKEEFPYGNVSQIRRIRHSKYGHRNERERRCDVPDVVSEDPSPEGDSYLQEREMEPEYRVEVKMEPVDTETSVMVDLLQVDKHELVDDVWEADNTVGNEPETIREQRAKSTIESNVKNLKCVPEKVFDEFYIGSVLKKHVVEAVKKKKKNNVDVKKNEYVKECVKDLLGRNKEVQSTKKSARRRTIKRTVRKEKNETEENRTEDRGRDCCSTGDKEKPKHVDGPVSTDRGFRLNFHQCYVCFKLFSTKSQLLNHCKDHFDICSETMLTRCPICQYVTKKDIKRHMREKHDMNLDIPFSRIKEMTNCNGSSRYCFEVDDTVLEVIPSVKNLNKIESMKIDKKRREFRDKFIGKTKLVKKGGEWIVENVEIDKQEYVLPAEFSYGNNGEYLERIREFSRRVKNEGKKMLFPCNECEKKCQTLSALKLHFRRHEKNPKPFKPKKWKHKGDVEEEKTVTQNSNRLERPKPIVARHKCDTSLMEFYKKNIRGGDVEFWQFLKIYNRMSRENVKEFEDLEARTDFGLHAKHISELDETEKAKLVKGGGGKLVLNISEGDLSKKEKIRA